MLPLFFNILRAPKFTTWLPPDAVHMCLTHVANNVSLNVFIIRWTQLYRCCIFGLFGSATCFGQNSHHQV